MRVCVRTCSPFDSSALTRNVNLVKSCPCDTPLVNSGGTAILFQSYLEQDLRNQVQVQTGESTLTRSCLKISRNDRMLCSVSIVFSLFFSFYFLICNTTTIITITIQIYMYTHTQKSHSEYNYYYRMSEPEGKSKLVPALPPSLFLGPGKTFQNRSVSSPAPVTIV